MFRLLLCSSFFLLFYSCGPEARCNALMITQTKRKNKQRWLRNNLFTRENLRPFARDNRQNNCCLQKLPLKGGNTKLDIHGSTAMRKTKRRESRRGTLAMGLFGIHTGSDRKRAYGEKER